MTKLRREKKLIPQEQKGLGDKGRQRFDTWSTAVSEMSPTPTTRPALIFKALSPADSTGPLPSSFEKHRTIRVSLTWKNSPEIEKVRVRS